MHALRVAILVAWIAFGIYWLVSSRDVKPGTGGRRGIAVRGAIALALFALFRFAGTGNLELSGPVPAVLGTALFAGGLGLAIWARLHLGRNWGMPQTLKSEPELITSGPYRLLRHPIYTGILTAVLGTALAVSLAALVVALIVGAYFFVSARIEERNLTAAFPDTYPAYRARTWMLVPLVI